MGSMRLCLPMYPPPAKVDGSLLNYCFLSALTVLAKRVKKIMFPFFFHLEPNRTFLKCEAKNYSGIFICSWMTENESPNVKFTIRSLKG